jgi:hypothetical protein
MGSAAFALTCALAPRQVPTTSTVATASTTGTTTTISPGDSALLDRAEGVVSCTADVIVSLRCGLVASVVVYPQFQYEWTLDGTTLTDETGPQLKGSHFLTVGTHHVEVVAFLGSHRSAPFAQVVTVRPPPPLPGPKDVKLPLYFWYILASLALTCVLSVVKKLRGP